MRIALSSFVVLGVLLLPNFALAKAYTVHKLPKQIGGVCQYDPNTPEAGKGPFGNIKPTLTSYEPGNGAADSDIGPKGCTDPYPDKLNTDGGISQLLQNSVTLNQVMNLANVIRQASPDELRQLFPSLKYKTDMDIKYIYKHSIFSDVRRIGISNLENVLLGGSEAAKNGVEDVMSMGVKKVAEALGVSKRAVRVVEVSLSLKSSVPDYTFRQTVYEYLKHEHDKSDANSITV